MVNALPISEKEGPHLKIADYLLSRTVLLLIPRSVSPNFVTAIRFISIPLIAVLLLMQSYDWGAVVFAIAAFTDALDGAMARTRHQITAWGKIADPLADKLLISTTALIIVTRYIGLWMAGILIAVELAIMARATYNITRGRETEANATGKIKMFLQSLSLLCLFAYLLFHVPVFLLLAIGGLATAILFALISLFLYSSL